MNTADAAYLSAIREVSALKLRIDSLAEIVERYLLLHPAFRIKPEGAPGSPVRIEQERQLALEDAAKAALALVGGV